MKKLYLLTVIAAIATSFFAGCYNDHKEDLYPVLPITSCDTTNITYGNTIKGIVDNQCATAGCHNGPDPSGWDFTSYSGIKAVADNGKLMPALNHTGPLPMPKDLPPLDACSIAKFQAWVNHNAPQ